MQLYTFNVILTSVDVNATLYKHHVPDGKMLRCPATDLDLLSLLMAVCSNNECNYSNR